MRSIVFKDTGEGYLQMLHRAPGLKMPSNEVLSFMGRQCKGKKASNTDWESSTDPDAKVVQMKDGRTRLTCKPEHAVYLDTGAGFEVGRHSEDQGNTKALDETPEGTKTNLEKVGKELSAGSPTKLIADKGPTLAASLRSWAIAPGKYGSQSRNAKGLTGGRGL
jgi:hypothetical protein